MAAIGCVLGMGLVSAQRGTQPAGTQPPGGEVWVLYSLPGTLHQLTARWRLLRIEGETLVIRIDVYLDGALRSSRELRGSRLRVPPRSRRETIVSGGRKYDCHVFEQGNMTFWYSEDVPLFGIVRSQRGERDVMEILDSSTPRQR